MLWFHQNLLLIGGSVWIVLLFFYPVFMEQTTGGVKSGWVAVAGARRSRWEFRELLTVAVVLLILYFSSMCFTLEVSSVSNSVSIRFGFSQIRIFSIFGWWGGGLLAYSGLVAAGVLSVSSVSGICLVWLKKKSICKETKLVDQNCDSRDLHPSFISFWIPLAWGRLLIWFTVTLFLSANGNLCWWRSQVDPSWTRAGGPFAS